MHRPPPGGSVRALAAAGRVRGVGVCAQATAFTDATPITFFLKTFVGPVVGGR